MSLQVSKVIIYIVVIEQIQVEVSSFPEQVKIFEDSSILAWTHGVCFLGRLFHTPIPFPFLPRYLFCSLFHPDC